jgi:hypothetical protein
MKQFRLGLVLKLPQKIHLHDPVSRNGIQVEFSEASF